LQTINSKLQLREISIEQAIVKALPVLRGKVDDETLHWLVNELQGYGNSLEFYQNERHGLPEYRVISGKLELMSPSGQIAPFEHQFAKRGRYFLNAPVAWLEGFLSLPGNTVVVELPDLATYLGSGMGNVICQCPRSELIKMLVIIRQKVMSVLTQAEI
jgi:hypothetical protein